MMGMARSQAPSDFRTLDGLKPAKFAKNFYIDAAEAAIEEMLNIGLETMDKYVRGATNAYMTWADLIRAAWGAEHPLAQATTVVSRDAFMLGAEAVRTTMEDCRNDSPLLELVPDEKLYLSRVSNPLMVQPPAPAAAEEEIGDFTGTLPG